MGIVRTPGRQQSRHITPIAASEDNKSTTRDNKQKKDFLAKISAKEVEFENRKHRMSEAKMIQKKSPEHSQKHEKGDLRSRQVPGQAADSSVTVAKRSYLLVHLSILLSAVILFLLFSLDSHINADEQGASSRVEFNFSNIGALTGIEE